MFLLALNLIDLPVMQVDLRRRGLQSFDPAEFANSEEHLQLLLQVRQLDLSHNALYTIRGLEGLTHLTVLNISNNGLRSLGGGLPLTLRELDASHNCLGTLQNAALLPLQSLVSLNVSFNELEDLRGVPNVTAQLSYLDVRSNRLNSLQGVEHCALLRTLHAEANLLREVADMASLKCLSSLKEVFLEGNPLLLRKRLLHQVRLMLPPSVDQDDVPTMTPPSSVRTSTAPPPSVPDTSSIASLESSTSVSYTDVNNVSRLSSQPASEHIRGPPLPASKHHHSAPQAFTSTKSTAATTSVAASRPPLRASASAALRATPSATRNASPLLSSTMAASAAPPPAGVGASLGVVGGDADSPSCPRRALPHEHRLDGSPVSAKPASPERFAGPSPPFAPAAAALLLRSTPPPGFSSPARPPTTSHTATAASMGKVERPRQPERRVGSTGRMSRELTREELEEQLVRVMAERDAYRRESIALRGEVVALQQLLAAKEAEEDDNDDAATTARHAPQHTSSSDLMPSAFSDAHTATLNSLPSPIPSRTALSTDATSSKDASALELRPRQPQRLQNDDAAAVSTATGRPATRILAVEMSGHSSSTTSEMGDKRAAAPEKAQDGASNGGGGRAENTNGTHVDPVGSAPSPTPTPVDHQQRRKIAPTATSDRRAIAALFMSKLQKSSVQ